MNNIKCIKYKEIGDIVNAYNSGTMFHDGIIITASRNISRILKRELDTTDNVVTSIGDILEEIFPGGERRNIVYEQIELNEIIDAKRIDLGENEYKFLKKSSRNVLKAIKTGCELGIDSKIINTQDDTEKKFIKIYDEFIRTSPSIQIFISKLVMLENKDQFTKILRSIDIDIEKIKTIYLQGFFYIRPLQQRFIEALQNLPVQICFLNNYDDRNKHAYEVWDLLYADKNNEAQYVPSQGDKKYYFNEIFMDEVKSVNKYVKPQATVTEFNDIFSFVRYIGTFNQKDVTVVCPNKKEIRDIFDIYFPDKEDKKHFLAYPIGQYILSLHDMWNLENNRVKCTVEAIRSCLASGWANREDKNSDKYLTYFEKVKEYFYGCESINDWKERMALLVKVYDEILPIFADESSNARWVKILGNPMLNVGAFSLTKEQLLELDKILNDIFSNVEILFKDEDMDKKKDVSVHFKQLRKIVEEREKVHTVEEEEVIGNIISRLGMLPKEKLSCSIENLIDAMQLFLGGENKDDENEINSGANIFATDEAEYVMCHHRKNVLFCFCDDKNVPSEKEREPWLFSQKLLENTNFRNEKLKRRIDFYLMNLQAKQISSRYLFFRLMQIPEINLSWISEYGNKNHSPSIYVNLLINPAFYGLEVEQYNESLLKGKNKYKGDQSMPTFSKYKLEDAHTEGLKEPTLCEKLCKYSKFYNYGLVEHPEFNSRFHLNFFACYLIILLTKANNPADYSLEIRDFAYEVFKLLPMFNESEQKQIISFARRKYKMVNDKTYDYFEGKKYHNNRLFLKFLEMYYAGSDGEPSVNRNCVYCPYVESCYFKETVKGV